jgi:ankyrin repeat protein
VKKLIVLVALIQTAAGSSYAQTRNFFELVQSGTPQTIQIALDKGADVNARDKEGSTPLMMATMHNENTAVITTLLKAGADLNTRNKYGTTALMVAAGRNQNPGVITILLKASANAKAKDSERKTAFDYAHDNMKLNGTDAYRKLNEAQY